MTLVKATLKNLNSIVGKIVVACHGCATCVPYAEAVKKKWLADRSRGLMDPDYYCTASCHDSPKVLRKTRTRSKPEPEPVAPRHVRRVRSQS